MVPGCTYAVYEWLLVMFIVKQILINMRNKNSWRSSVNRFEFTPCFSPRNVSLDSLLNYPFAHSQRNSRGNKSARYNLCVLGSNRSSSTIMNTGLKAELEPFQSSS